MRTQRSTADHIVLVLLVVTGIAGLVNGPADLPGAATLTQRVLSLSVALYGLSGVVAAWLLWRQSRWTVPVMLVWGVGALLAAVLGPIAYGVVRAPWWVAALSGLVACAITGPAIRHAHLSLRRAHSLPDLRAKQTS